MEMRVSFSQLAVQSCSVSHSPVHLLEWKDTCFAFVLEHNEKREGAVCYFGVC